MKMDMYNIPYFKNDWTLFFMKLGHLFYNENKFSKDQGKLNIAISVPFNHYTALTISAGMAHAIYSNGHTDEIFELARLKNLEKGTLVFYSEAKKGSVEKSYIYNGISQAGFPILKGIGKNKTMVMTLQKKESWKNIRVAPEQNIYKTQRTIQNDSKIEILSRYYDIEIIKDSFNRGLPFFLIAGNENQLSYEAEQQLDDFLTIQDYVRIKKIGGSQYSYISDLISSEMNTNIKEVPYIIDGANLYIRHKDELNNEAKIIILSRENTMGKNIDALDLIERDFITSNTADDINVLNKLICFQPPPNIELLCWRALNE